VAPNAIASPLISPYGGMLVDLVVPAGELAEAREYAHSLPSIVLSDRSVCDLEMLACGAFSPLDRFMSEADLLRVLEEMRLAGGQIFPIPVTLPVQLEEPVRPGRSVALRNSLNSVLAIMRIEEVFSWNPEDVAAEITGTRDLRHPLVAEMKSERRTCISGTVRVLDLPRYYDFPALRRTPSETRRLIESFGRSNVVAFQTRNPLHRAHEEMTRRAIVATNGTLLIHPAVGMTKPGDIDHFSRVRSYRMMVARYYRDYPVVLSLAPLAMRMAGPREALWHAVIRRNYGANHLIVGRDHASPGLDSRGHPFYKPYDAQELVARFSAETGVQAVPFSEMVYLPQKGGYEELSQVDETIQRLAISGTEVREKYLEAGRRLPDWFTRPEVAEILYQATPPRHRRGICIWLTGLSGAGKSTIANILTTQLSAHGRQVTLLDGDVVRTNLSKGLGFSREDRDTNVLRVGFVASEVVRHGGVVICAIVSPYGAGRAEVRSMVGNARFVEVFVDCPLEVCESRDVKGIYARARRGEIKSLTGIDDPYEEPASPEIRLNTAGPTAEESAEVVLNYLRAQGFIRDDLAETLESDDLSTGGVLS
jgi:sulfate adenylyltransferase